jgi:signal transduction histidine kinase/CheY-like chemotaxis protein
MFRLIKPAVLAIVMHTLSGSSLACADELEDRLQKFETAFSTGPGNPYVAARELIDWGQQSGDTQTEARGYLRLALMDAVPNNEHSGWRTNLRRGIKLAGTDKTEARAEALLFQGYIKGRADSLIDDGLATIEEAIVLARELQSDRVLALSYLLSAELLRVRNRKSQARNYSFRCQAFAKRTKSPGLQAIALRKIVDDLTRFRCYKDGIPYARELMNISKGHAGLAERLLYRAGELPDYENRLRKRITQQSATNPTGRNQLMLARQQLNLVALIMKKAPEEAASIIPDVIEAFEAHKDHTWTKFGKLIYAMIPQPGETSTAAYQRFDEVRSQHQKALRWMAEELNIDVAAFMEDHQQWKAATEWRRSEAKQMYDWVNDSTGDAASSARAFMENELRLRKERDRITGERNKIAFEREEMAAERSGFAEERQRFSRTQLGLIWITGMAVVGAFGTRMFVMSRHRKQLQGEVDRKTASLQLAKQDAELARDRAQCADKAKTDFLACMNHEIRNPLNAILGYSQLLQREPADLSSHELRGIESSTEHLLQLVNNVLDMSSIENGEIGIYERRFDLHGLCESVDDILKHTAAHKGVAFYVEIDPSVPRYVVGDESKLRQTLINLCSNGIKFTAEGQVKLAMSSTDKSDNQFQLQALVKDSGSGLSEIDLESLFAPYTQSTIARETRSGSGLGLYICKSFADRMGGTLTGRNSESGGAEFELTVPLKIAAGPLDNDTVPGITPDGTATPKVLVVDDNRENLETIARALQAMGYETRTADSKSPAVRETQSWRPDFVFLDIHMPGADGFEVAQAIRDTDAGLDLKIIAITGDAIASVRQRALNSGFDAFLTKPVRLKTIEQAIGELLHS